jgi:hypothetical protein
MMMVWKIVGFALLWCVIVLTAFGILVYLSLPFPNTHPVALYNRMYLNFADDHSTSIVVFKSTGPTEHQASLCVRLPDGRVVRAIEMTHADVDQLSLEHSMGTNSNGTTYDRYCRGFTLISFSGDHPRLVKFCQYFPVDLAPTPKGPWFRLPISKRQMYELFGKPEKWERWRTHGV